MSLFRAVYLKYLLLLPLLFGCTLFGPSFTLTLRVDNDVGGEIICDPDRAEYSMNTRVALTAVADDGYTFAHWVGARDEYNPSSSVIVDANRVVTAVFKPMLSNNNPTDDVILPVSAEFSPDPANTWTFMVYLDGDNNLQPYALSDFNEMEQGLYDCVNPNLTIIVLFDRCDDGTADEEWKDSRYYRILPDNTDEIASERLDDGIQMEELGELPMNDPQTLQDFLAFCRTDFPADHYALILWNHGGGARSINLPDYSQTRQICEDESSPGDYLYLDEIQQAVEAGIPETLDLIGIDACIMGTVEVAYEFRDLADCFVASMSDVNSDGWDYAALFGRMNHPAVGSGGNPEDLAKLMVDSYREATRNFSDQTISAINLSNIDNLKTAVDNLAGELFLLDKKHILEDLRDATVHFFLDEYELQRIEQPYYDLNDFCYLLINNEDFLSPTITEAAEGVVAELGNCVVSAYGGTVFGNYYGLGADVKRGLSIFFSNGDLIYGNLSHYSYQYWYTDVDTVSRWGPYGLIDFCTSNENNLVETWRELMEAWYDPFRSPVGFTPGCW